MTQAGLLRYVVLHHTGIGQPHFDVMMETAPGSPLATWRCPHWPPQPADAFTPLGEHRRDYLDYEGPVSGNRGQVRRVAAGHVQSIAISADQWTVVLDDGTRLVLPRSG
ncbi:MAG: hypothetical protein ABR964_12405 [Tepidisphaeraceae bacterium]|jgi:hypothetical protein